MTPLDPPPLAPPPRADSVVELVTRKSEPDIVQLEARKSAPRVSVPDIDTEDEVIGERGNFPRSESVQMEAQAYVPRKRAKRATSEGDYGDYSVDEDAMTNADAAAAMREQNQGPPRPPTETGTPRAASYLEYALRAGLPRKAGTDVPTDLLEEPPARDSEMKIEPVPTKVLEAALRFDSEPKPEEFQPVPTKVLDAALRFDSEPSAEQPEAPPPPPPPTPPAPKPAPKPEAAKPKAPLPPPRTELAVPKLALGDRAASPPLGIGKVDTKILEHAIRPESEPAILVSRAESDFDYSSLALDNDGSGRMVMEKVPRANSALERALRDSSASLDRPIEVEDDDDEDVGEESGDFGEAIAPLRTMKLAERQPSLTDELLERQDMPILQLAVYETATHLAMASAAIVESGHAITVSTSEREGLEQIGIAMTDGHIDAILVGIPGGEVLIKAAMTLAPWGPIVIASCSGGSGDATRMANEAGADLVAIRPHDPDRLGPVLHAAARILEQRRDLMLAQQGREEDLLTRLGSEGDADDGGGLLAFEEFQRALELELKRVRRYQYALTLALFALDIESEQPPPAGIKGILRARAGNALLHSIRDIDMATELDQDRFLVLLPYTDLTGATEVARRIIRAVGAIDPVVAAGGEFQVRLVGAIAGTKPGQQLSFNKLIRDAQRALEAARRDGAELAVQP